MRAVKARKGFTLIEIMVVLSIIGVLLSMAGKRNTIALERAKDAALMLEIGHIRNAIHQYALDNSGNFPTSLVELHPKYLTRKIENWQGSRARGIYHYDPALGIIHLFDARQGGPANAQDSRGRSYGDY